MAEFETDTLTFENGVMFGRVTIDGAPVRAGITLPAFEQLVGRAGFASDRDLAQVTVGEVLDQLRPTIEAYLQSKHFTCPNDDDALIIDLADLVTH